MSAGTLTIIRRNDRDDKPQLYMELRDEASRQTFLKLSISAEELMLGLTAMACRPVDFTLVHPERVGLTKITEDRQVVIPHSMGIAFDRDAIRKHIEEHHQEPGWLLDAALSSRGSLVHDEGQTTAHYRVYRYAEPGHE